MNSKQEEIPDYIEYKKFGGPVVYKILIYQNLLERIEKSYKK